MDHSIRAFTDGTFEEEDWESRGWTGFGVRGARPSDLRNPIHPIFSLDRHSSIQQDDSSRRWTTVDRDLTAEEYDLMAPALRLASKLIESPASVGLLHSLWHGRWDASGETRRGLPIMQLHRNHLPDAEVRPAVEVSLRKLSESITFRFLGRESPLVADGSHGVTSPSFRTSIQILADPSVKGVASGILVDERYLEGLRSQARSPQMLFVHTQKTLNLNFRLAVTLCHEFLHAAYFAIDTYLHDEFMKGNAYNRSNEPFLANEICAELGFCWENVVFGGAIGQGSDDYLQEALWVVEWPSHLYWDAERQPSRGLPPQHSTTYLVSTYYVQNIQTEDFWQLVTNSPIALRIKRSLGIRVFCKTNDCDKDLPPRPDEQWNPENDRVERDYKSPDIPSARANETRDAEIARLTAEYDRLHWDSRT